MRRHDAGVRQRLNSLHDWLPDTADAQLPCRTHDPDLFFAEAPADIERAKVICRDCPVRQRCLASALQRQEPWGVWGGEYFDGGNVIPHKRPMGRPRKHPMPALT